jgi:superfamily II RNA helicase
MYQWRDDVYGGNFQTKTNNPTEVKKALEAKRKEFKDAGNKPVEPKVEPKPFNQEEWNKELLKEVEALKAKKTTEAMSKEDRLAKLKKAHEKVKATKSAKSAKSAKAEKMAATKSAKAEAAFSKMDKTAPGDLDDVLDAWGGDVDDKAGFIKWLKSDKAYTRARYDAELRKAISRLREHIE